MRRFGSALLATSLLLANSSTPALAWNTNCSFSGGAAVGQSELQAYTRGSRATIEFYPHALCFGRAQAFAADWVAVTNQRNAFDIFQIGINRCRVLCAPGQAEDVPHFFWAYGHESSVECGEAVPPEEQPITGTPSGNHFFKVEKNNGPYEASLDGVVKASKSAHHLEDCWFGVFYAEFVNETVDTGTQVGGHDGNRQTFINPKWRDNNGVWHDVNRTPGANCDVRSKVNCKVAADGDDTNRWDDRGP